MKILVIANLYEPYIIGGGEISTKLLVDNLTKLGHEVVVLTSYSKDLEDQKLDGATIKRIKNNVYWSYEKDKKSNLKKVIWHIVDEYNFIASRKIERILYRGCYDLVISSTIDGFSGNIWEIAKEKGIKTIHILRSYSLVCLNAGMFKNGKNCKAQCSSCRIFNLNKKRQSNKYVDAVIGISYFILDKHLKLGLFQNSKNRVIHNSINLLEKIELQVPERNKFRIGYVGSIQQKKGVELLLRSFKELENNEGFELHLYGKPIISHYLKGLDLKNHKNVYHHGYVSQDKLFPAIDILVVPSLWEEPFGRIVIEAYKYGVPVIGSDKGGIPELIEKGKTGYVYEANNQHDLIEKILLMSKNWEQFREPALQRAKQFSSDRIFFELNSFLEEVVNG